jgi:hypothetical protein
VCYDAKYLDNVESVDGEISYELAMTWIEAVVIFKSAW